MTKETLLKEYKGEAFLPKINELARNVFLTNRAYMKIAFGENVDYERYSDYMLLCSETEEILYEAPELPVYERGSRPILEAAVEEATKGCTSEREVVLGLMSYIRDLRKKSHGYDYFYGGTEEELIKKGERYCERVARLMCGLCEIAGIPARTIFHVSGGHLTNEVFVEGKWSYIDPRFGLFYVGEDGKMMSVVEIMRNRDVIYNQPDWVYAYGSDESTTEYKCRENHDLYLRPLELQLYAYYSLADKDKYHFEWTPSAAFAMPERDAAYREYAAARMAYINATKC